MHYQKTFYLHLRLAMRIKVQYLLQSTRNQQNHHLQHLYLNNPSTNLTSHLLTYNTICNYSQGKRLSYQYQQSRMHLNFCILRNLCKPWLNMDWVLDTTQCMIILQCCFHPIQYPDIYQVMLTVQTQTRLLSVCDINHPLMNLDYGKQNKWGSYYYKSIKSSLQTIARGP